MIYIELIILALTTMEPYKILCLWFVKHTGTLASVVFAVLNVMQLATSSDASEIFMTDGNEQSVSSK